MKNPFLVGRSIYLRPLEPDDAPTVAPWLNDHDVRRTLNVHRPFSVAKEREFLEGLAKKTDVTLGIVLARGDHLIGVTGLFQLSERDRHAGWGIFIGDKRRWGRGHGTEACRMLVDYAFGTLNLNRVWLQVLAGNQRGIRAYKTAGFNVEGVLRQHGFQDGAYVDMLTMAILREEWAQPKRARRR